jgi:hypothetical protein
MGVAARHRARDRPWVGSSYDRFDGHVSTIGRESQVSS